MILQNNRPSQRSGTAEQGAGLISRLIDGTPYGGCYSETRERIAVRAVVRRSTEVLLIHSVKNGDFKFPGGGVKPGETRRKALGRELLEECGAELVEMGKPLLSITEQRPLRENGGILFRMVSLYYPCSAGEAIRRQNLDSYEEALGFSPVWISMEDAMSSNLALKGTENAPPWLEREILALKTIAEGCQTWLRRAATPS
jgi:8-oxo-dGTP diphosphatase